MNEKTYQRNRYRVTIDQHPIADQVGEREFSTYEDAHRFAAWVAEQSVRSTASEHAMQPFTVAIWLDLAAPVTVGGRTWDTAEVIRVHGLVGSVALATDPACC